MAIINGNNVLFNAQITGLVAIDDTMSNTSENPVQNKVIKAYVDANSGGGTSNALKSAKCPLYVDTTEFLTYRKRSAAIGSRTFTFSGTAGSGVLQLSNNSFTFTDAMIYTAMVVAYSGDNVNKYTVCHITAYDNDNQTLTVYPALEYNEAAGTLCAFVNDTQHITETGFKAYAQFIYKQNPKHCEKTKYLYRYMPINEPTPTAPSNYPFTILGTAYNGKRVGIGKADVYYPRFSQTNNDLTLYASNSSNELTGIEWEVALNGNSGYFEGFIGNGYRSAGSYGYTVPKDANYPLIIEWYLDGTLAQTITKTTNTVERICFDFERKNSLAKIKIYYANGVRANTDNLSIGNLTFYVNEYEHEDLLIPYGSATSMICDSWGAFNDGATGTELKRLINNEVGFETSFENHSVGGKTARWGKGRFYDFAHKDNASVVIYDFAINDLNGIRAGLSDTFVNDNGTSYELYESTYAEYINTIRTLMQMSVSNNMLPIWAGCFILGTTQYYEAQARFFEDIPQAF